MSASDTEQKEALGEIPLPWQKESWERIQQTRSADRMTHALLINGAAGLGKTSFARALGKALHCQQPDREGRACGTCSYCRQFSAGSHPDWTEVSILPDKKLIGVEQIRDLVDWFSLTASEGSGRVALIQPADKMTINSANSLLKTLEEPPAGGLLMLVTPVPGRIPATVRSRCQRVDLRRPLRNEALEWLGTQPGLQEDWPALLDLAQGSPLRAQELREKGILEQAQKGTRQLLDLARGRGRDTVVGVAGEWVKQGLREQLTWWQAWLEALCRQGQTDNAQQPALLSDHAEDLQKILPRIDWRAVHELMLALGEAERRLEYANEYLLAESLLGRWVRAFRKGENVA